MNVTKYGRLNTKYNMKATHNEIMVLQICNPRITLKFLNLYIETKPAKDGKTLRRSIGPRGLDRFPRKTPNAKPYTPGHPKNGTNPISALAIRIWI